MQKKDLRSKLVKEFHRHLRKHVTPLCTAAVKNSPLNFGPSVSCAEHLYAFYFLMQLHTRRKKQLMIFPLYPKHNWEYSPLPRNRKHQNKTSGKKENLNVTLESSQSQAASVACLALIGLFYQPDPLCPPSKRSLCLTPTTKWKKTWRSLLIGAYI